MEVLEQRGSDSSTLALALALSEPLAFAFQDALPETRAFALQDALPEPFTFAFQDALPDSFAFAFDDSFADAFADTFGAASFDEFLSGGHSCGVHGVGMELVGSMKDSVWVVFCVESVEQKGGERIC